MSEVFQEDQVTDKIRYWGEQQDALGFETVWSMWEFTSVDNNIFKDRQYRICYKFYANDVTVDQLLDNTAVLTEVSAIAANGSVRELWRAAESCYQQAKLLGDWHRFIEDMVMTNDSRSFELTMGS